MSSPTIADRPGAICGHCGALLHEFAWRELELVETVAPGRVRGIVTHWPDGKGIEVRRCRCGRAVARIAFNP